MRIKRNRAAGRDAFGHNDKLFFIVFILVLLSFAIPLVNEHHEKLVEAGETGLSLGWLWAKLVGGLMLVSAVLGLTAFAGAKYLEYTAGKSSSDDDYVYEEESFNVDQEILEDWEDVVLSSEPADHEAAERAVSELYKNAGYKQPDAFVWFDSPLSGFMASSICGHVPEGIGKYVFEKVYERFRNKHCMKAEHISWDESWDYAGLLDSLNRVLEDSVIESINNMAGDDPVWNEIKYSLHDVFKKKFGYSLPGWVAQRSAQYDSEWGHGMLDAGWLAIVDAARPGFGVSDELMEVHRALAENALWWWPYERAVIMVEKPVCIETDGNGRPHATGRKAVEFKDGFGVYMVHGTAIPEKWGAVPPNEWSPKWLLETKNAEIRRTILQTCGYGRVMEELGSKLVHEDGDMELRRIESKVDVESILLLKVVDPSSGLPYVLRVPPHYKNCEAARAWTLWGHDKNDFFTET